MNHSLKFTAEKITQRLQLIKPLVFRRRVPLAAFRIRELPDAQVDPPLHEAPEDWPEIPHETYWGRANLNFLMKTSFTVPPGWNPFSLALFLPLGEAGDIFTHPEGLVYLDGRPVASADRYHHTVPLPGSCGTGQLHQIALHGWTGLSGWPPDPYSREKLFMGKCELVERHRPTQDFLFRASAALDTAQVLADGQPERHGLLSALDAAFKVLDTRDPLGSVFYDTVGQATETLVAGIAAAGRPLDVTLHAIGHAHMDIAYLWPVSQIRRKTARTYSNALRLMAEYPEFKFSNSQPQLYDFTETDYPQISGRIGQKVATRQWEVMGGMWVEADLNLPGAESLVRQLVLGRRYFTQKYGNRETPILFLPDTFGFPATIPQLMALAGLKWFCTNKLNWNQTNRMPSSTTWWEGVDGTRVLAHVLTTPREVQYLPFPTNYKSDLSAREVLGTWTHSTAKHAIRDLPICFGYGDGGGGPTEGLIRTALSYGDMPGMPRLKMSTMRECFTAMERNAADLPVWSGEMYMEGHRGVLTSQGWIKRANRQAEAALHEAEALAAMAGTRPDLTQAWQRLCLNQFHDIITGTSVTEVFDDARDDYADIAQMTDLAADAALAALPDGQAWVAFNTAPLTTTRQAVVNAACDVPGQQIDGGKLVFVPHAAPYAVIPLQASGPTGPLSAIATARGAVLENDMIRVEINDLGQIGRILDKEVRRDVLPAGQMGNRLQVFEDRPISWDAWDIDPFFEDRAHEIDTPCQIQITETGPLRAAVLVTRPFRDSTISQSIRLMSHSKRIDFVTEIDWHQTHELLKVAFPVDILNTHATYDIQWGSIRRPTHRNTTWDMARYEVPAQKWADLSEGNYGVALLNDCKYGYDVSGNVLRLSLIKSSTMPDPVADQGRHVMTYALLPHRGDWRGGVRAEAYDLNLPLRVGRGVAAAPLVQSDAPNVVIETVKPADDGDGVILRLYEALKYRGPVQLRFRDTLGSAAICDLLETEIEQVRIEGETLDLDLTPHQIVTLRVRFQRNSDSKANDA